MKSGACGDETTEMTGDKLSKSMIIIAMIPIFYVFALIMVNNDPTRRPILFKLVVILCSVLRVTTKKLIYFQDNDFLMCNLHLWRTSGRFIAPTQRCVDWVKSSTGLGFRYSISSPQPNGNICEPGNLYLEGYS
jgi:hypothetical protein